MPLTPGAPASESIRELHTGNTFKKTAAKFGKADAQRQSIAIALSNERKGRASGGVANYDTGGTVDPVSAVISALSAGDSASASAPGIGGASANPSSPSSTQATAVTNTPPPTSTSGIAPAVPTPSTATPAATAPAGVAPPATLPSPTTATVATGQPSTPIANKLMATGGVTNAFPSAKPPSAVSPWQVRQEAKGMHTGPLLGPAPGRSDTRYTKVASGSYILPSSHLASLGQGNSVSGLAIAHKMFSGGPYGTGGVKMTGGAGAPKPPAPPRQPKFSSGGYSDGGGRGDGHHVPVDVALSDGEFSIGPEELIRRYGSLKNAHEILDKWVLDTRKKEIKTLKKLPPPAKK